jgi:selenocysteine lyase/cysteine desulfurase
MTSRRSFITSCTAAAIGGAMVQAQDADWRSLFPAVRAADRDAIYLDSAATTHRAQAVIDAIVEFYILPTRDKRSPRS